MTSKLSDAERALFLNRLRSLFFIDSDRLPELTAEQQAAFQVDPVHYVIRASEQHAAAIWREIEVHQANARARVEEAIAGRGQ